VSLAVHGALYFGFNMRNAAPTPWTAIQLSILLTGIGVVCCDRNPAKFIDEIYIAHSKVLMWLTILFFVFLSYACFNFFYNDYLLHYGYLDIVGRHHVIVNKGRLVKSILPEELPTYQMYEARKYSGHWMICNVILCVMALVNAKFGDWTSKGETAHS
jgi:hypothetical protein